MPSPRLPRPATILAFAALVIALTGSAIAAKKYVITSTKQIKPSVLVQLKGKAGPAGPKGDTGAAGAKGDTGAAGTNGTNGAAGTPGTNGTDGTNGIGGGMASAMVFTGATAVYGMFGWQTNAGAAPGPQLTPNTALVLKEFALSVPALAGSETITATIQLNNVDSAVTCTVTAPTTLCTSSETLNVPARSLLGVKLAAGALAANRQAAWSESFE